jgi:CMP-N-acetylneuraminic acid synthetase
MLEPPEAISNSIKTAPTIAEFVDNMLAGAGENWDIMIGLTACAPLISPEDIDNALKLMIQSDGKHQVTAFRKAREYPWWMKYADGSGFVIPELGKIASRDSQSLPDLMYPVGTLMVDSQETIQDALTNTDIASAKKIPYVLPPERAIDIDDAHDFYLAKCIMEQKQAVPDWNNLHYGKRAWILATGPSLADVTPEQWALIDQDITIGVNNAPTVHDSKYLLWSDVNAPKVLPSIITSEAEYKFTLDCDRKCEEVPDVVYYKPCPSASTTFEGGLTARQNSAHAALNLAIVMGCNPIVLMGVDFKECTHAVQQKGDDASVLYDPDGKKAANWQVVADACGHLDVRIINSLEDSGLECFPRVSIDKILAGEKIAIPQPKVSDNGKGPLMSLIAQTKKTVQQLEFCNQALPEVMKRLMPRHKVQVMSPDTKPVERS